MKISDFLCMLLHKLQQLYYRIAVSRLHKLMDRYHSYTSHSKKSHANDIKTSILEYVDNIVVVEKEKNITKGSNDTDHPVTEAGVAAKHVTQSHHDLFPFKSDEKDDGPNPYALNKKQVDELSKYFKAREKGPELHHDMEEKLRDSIWAHMNASVQCALKGDGRSAKMHADIADYAFKEIAHYMPKEQYLELTEKINRRLDTLKVNQDNNGGQATI
ncbi:MAG: hypothetical protein GQ572_08025 [Gammaproteobacteria bacterium]|nr:hypothetical protein [Gammaproteobacteria bacterium]